MTTSADFPLVFIPAAGLGSRVSKFGISKPLISIGQLPAIGQLMLQYPQGTEFLVALGHKGEYLEQVLKAFSEHYGLKVNYVWTDSYRMPVTKFKGLTKTVLDARSLLQRPFIFHSVDTLLQGSAWLESISTPIDMVVMSPTQDAGTYRVVCENKLSKANCARGDLAYVGVSRIQDFRRFWVEFDDRLPSSSSEEGESLGIALDQFKIETLASGTWEDLGNPVQLKAAVANARNPDNVLNKADEAIWVFGEKMVKFHESPKFISERLSRSIALENFVPHCTSPSPNLLVYERSPGQVLSSCQSDSCFDGFLAFCLKFWDETENDKEIDDLDFLSFYKVKTVERLTAYLEMYPEDSRIVSVNGMNGKGIWSQIEAINWEQVATPTLARVHGDLHTENVIHDHATNRFVFVDWRQSIAGSLGAVGDLYYDLAKVLHGLIVDHATVGKGEFSVRDEDSRATQIAIQIPDNKSIWLSKFNGFVVDCGFDTSRVWLLTGLIFINIAPLHHEGYDRFLFRLGLLMLLSHNDPESRGGLEECLKFQ
jgi:hypothetical protein